MQQEHQKPGAPGRVCGSGHTNGSLSLFLVSWPQLKTLPSLGLYFLYLGTEAGCTVIPQAPQICEIGVTFPVFLLPSPSWAVLEAGALMVGKQAGSVLSQGGLCHSGRADKPVNK